MRKVAAVIGAVTAFSVGLAGAGAAVAATWCVRDLSCPAGGIKTQTTIQGAINAAAANDTILIGQGRFNEAVVSTKSLTIIGAGSTRTIVQSPAPAPTTTMTLGSGGNLEDVGIELAPGNSNVGLVLGGIATRIAVTAPAGSNSGLGVWMEQGTLEHSSVTLPGRQ